MEHRFLYTITASLFHPIVLFEMLVVGIVSLFVMKRVVDRPVIRWLTFIGLNVAFAALLEMLVPQLAK